MKKGKGMCYVHAIDFNSETGEMPTNGNVVKDLGVNDNGEHQGSVRIDQWLPTMENGYRRVEHRVAFLRGPIEEMGDFFKSHGQPLRGNIVRTLFDEPQWETHKEVYNKTTGEGMGYYHTYLFTEDVNAPTTVDLRGQNVGVVKSEAEEVAD